MLVGEVSKRTSIGRNGDFRNAAEGEIIWQGSQQGEEKSGEGAELTPRLKFVDDGHSCRNFGDG